MEAEAAAAAGTTLSLRRRNFQSTTCSVWRLTARGDDQSLPPFAIMHFLLPHHSVLESCARPRTCVPSFSLLANAPPLSIGKGSHLLKNLKDGIYAKWIHGAAYITPIHFTSSTLSTSGETDHQKRRDRPSLPPPASASVRPPSPPPILGTAALKAPRRPRLWQRRPRRWRTLELKRRQRREGGREGGRREERRGEGAALCGKITEGRCVRSFVRSRSLFSPSFLRSFLPES